MLHIISRSRFRTLSRRLAVLADELLFSLVVKLGVLFFALVSHKSDELFDIHILHLFCVILDNIELRFDNRNEFKSCKFAKQNVLSAAS